MKYLAFLLFVVCLLTSQRTNSFSQSSVVSASVKSNPHYVDGEILIKFKDDTATPTSRGEVAQEIFPDHRVTSESVSQKPGASTLLRFGNEISVGEAVRRAQADPRIEFAEPNFLYHTMETIPNDELFRQEWGLFDGMCRCEPSAHINTLRAWDITTGSDDIVVAVIDTGVDFAHPDLASNAWENPGEIPDNGLDDDGNGFIDDVHGWNFAGNSGNVYKDYDTDFHGTHVAGTIGAAGDNQIGVAGVAWRVKLMSVKFIGKGGQGSSSDAIKAIEYVIDQKKRGVNVRVINASWGGPGDSSLLRDAIRRAGKAGILFVCAAGNEEEDVDEVPSYPVAYSGDISTLISVTATMPLYGEMAAFSNFGHNTVSVGAPGFQIMSVRAGGGYIQLTGTSMATPHVTGIAVLLLAHEPSLTPAQIKDRILMTAEPKASLASRSVSAGLANAYNALINRIPTFPAPMIGSVTVTKKKIIVDGVGFVNGSSLILVDRVPVPATVFDESYTTPSGQVTRLKAKPGKQIMRSLFPSGVWVSVQVYNPMTSQWSNPWQAVLP